MSRSSVVETEQWPFVSVIIPVHDEEQRIQSCIEPLLSQTYPRQRYEILIVDNGSTDATRDVVQRYRVTLLIEDRIQSSYAARNKGLSHARGEIIAFTDADCTAVPEWIEEGVRALQSQSADLAGGRVRFVLSPRPSGAEIWDSLTNMQIEQNVQERGVAKTANLFVRAAVFDQVGAFPNEAQSGGDVIWTKRATLAGLKLAYAPAAEVAHPARQLGPLLKKQYRVGKGQVAIGRADASCWQTVPRILRRIRPHPRSTICVLLQESQPSTRHQRLWNVWLAAWLVNLATGLGNVAGWVSLGKE